MRRSPWRAFLPEAAVLAAAALLLFAGLGTDELRSADEATHAQVAREMARDGHWLFPTCRGEPYFEKPPLKFWLTAVAFLVAGESEFTARLGSALFGLATVAAVMALGRRFFSRGAGLAAGFALATTWEFLHNHCARTGELDSALLFFTAMLVLSAWRARVEGAPRHLYAAAAWMALGFLTKGHVILIPLAWLPLVAFARPSAAPVPRIPFRHWALAALLFLALAGPWFALQEIHYGGTWFAYNLRHNLAGYVRGRVENADVGAAYYLEELVWLDYPWPPLALVGLLLAFRRSAARGLPFARAARLWLPAWVASTAVVLHLSRTSLPWYHLPALLPLSILAGFALDRWWNAEGVAREPAWDKLWLALHLALFFAMPGFLECAQDWLWTRVAGDADAFDGLCEYFVRDPHQRSMVVALLALPAFAALPVGRAVARRLRLPRPELLASRARGVLLAGAAFLAMFMEAPDDTEDARAEARDLLARADPSGGPVVLHLFETQRPHSPHWNLSPAAYYYLASSPRVSWRHHPSERAAWDAFLGSARAPSLAIVPTEWLRAPASAPAETAALMEIRPCSLVLVRPAGSRRP